MNKIKKYVAEATGTAVLVFMGCGSAVFLGCDAAGGHMAVAFAFGLSIVAMAYVIGGVSGCHINPAVSLAAFLDKRIGIADFFGYVCCIGFSVAFFDAEQHDKSGGDATGEFAVHRNAGFKTSLYNCSHVRHLRYQY